MHTTIEYRPHLKGTLEVHISRDADGNVTQEAFTFASLASVLDVSPTTLEGRYARSNAKNVKINLRSGAGRPQRGFPLALLDDVIDAMTAPRARFDDSKPNNQTTNTPAHPRTLVPLLHNGEPHYTVQALADYYGVTTQTVRNRIKAAGLEARLVPTSSSAQGGRPRLAFRYVDLELVHTAVGYGAPQPPLAGSMESLPGAEDNPILHGLRVAGMTRQSRAENRTSPNDPAIQTLIAEIESLAPTPASAPEPDDFEQLLAQRAQHNALAAHPPAAPRSEFIQVATPQAWYELVTGEVRSDILNRYPVAPEDLSLKAYRVTEQGRSLGLSVTQDALYGYVAAMRSRMQDYLQPYEQVLLDKIDEFLPDGQPAEVIDAFGLWQAMHQMPVYISQLPKLRVRRRARKYGQTEIWDLLEAPPKGDTDKAEEARQERRVLLDSPALRAARTKYASTFITGKVWADSRYGTHVELDAKKAGWLTASRVVLEEVIAPFDEGWACKAQGFDLGDLDLC